MQLILETDAAHKKTKMSDLDNIQNNGIFDHVKLGDISNSNGVVKIVTNDTQESIPVIVETPEIDSKNEKEQSNNCTKENFELQFTEVTKDNEIKASKEILSKDSNLDTPNDTTEKLVLEETSLEDDAEETIIEPPSLIEKNPVESKSKLFLVKVRNIEELTNNSGVQSTEVILKNVTAENISNETLDEEKDVDVVVSSKVTYESKNEESKNHRENNSQCSTNEICKDPVIVPQNNVTNSEEYIKDLINDTLLVTKNKEVTDAQIEVINQYCKEDTEHGVQCSTDNKESENTYENSMQCSNNIESCKNIVINDVQKTLETKETLEKSDVIKNPSEETTTTDLKTDEIIESPTDIRVSKEKKHEEVPIREIINDSSLPINTYLHKTMEAVNDIMEIDDESQLNDKHLDKEHVMETDDENLNNDMKLKKNPEKISESNTIEKGTGEKVLEPEFELTYNDSSDDCVEVKETPTKITVITDDKVDDEIQESNKGEEKQSEPTLKATEKLSNTVEKSVKKMMSGLSNTLNILSDDEDDQEKDDIKDTVVNPTDNKCINIEDDDDIMLIDEDSCNKTEPSKNETQTEKIEPPPAFEDEVTEIKQITEITEDKSIENKLVKNIESDETKSEIPLKNDISPVVETSVVEKPNLNEKTEKTLKMDPPKPVVPKDFLKTFKTNVCEMTRDDLEEFCLLKIVESVIDRSHLSEVKSKLKVMSQTIEEWKKKTLMLTKQNRDLQIVLKTVQEEQKQKPDVPIAPLKITRSVGMQVYMNDYNERGVKRKGSAQTTSNARTVKQPPNPSAKSQISKPNVSIPVPRLVPASNNSPIKNIRPIPQQVQSSTVSSNSGKNTSPVLNGVKNSSPAKSAEKRPLSSVQSVTVDLTDDEPPAKQAAIARNVTQPPVRLISQNQLMAPRPPAINQQNSAGPRKVFIPINQNQNIRSGQTIMLKTLSPSQAPRPRSNAPMVRLPGPMRMQRPQPLRHPAPLPELAKQQQPPNWKALPPAPDLKISKVENGIVISWKIEGYQEDSYENIASYQLYAYQETSSPPSTLLWKKIGDVKALPLPMACTLTQFMAGYRYYFAVRAVDIRSRIGAFSLPGSILLLNK